MQFSFLSFIELQSSPAVVQVNSRHALCFSGLDFLGSHTTRWQWNNETWHVDTAMLGDDVRKAMWYCLKILLFELLVSVTCECFQGMITSRPCSLTSVVAKCLTIGVGALTSLVGRHWVWCIWKYISVRIQLDRFWTTTEPLVALILSYQNCTHLTCFVKFLCYRNTLEVNTDDCSEIDLMYLDGTPENGLYYV